MPPHSFTENLTVTASYRWRPTPDETWQYGHITFTHKSDLRPDYTLPQPKRKPSALTQERDKKEKL